MIGNVLEWTRSIYNPYPYIGDNDHEGFDGDDVTRVWRGGSVSIDGDETNLRVAARSAVKRVSGTPGVGFRVVSSRIRH